MAIVRNPVTLEVIEMKRVPLIPALGSEESIGKRLEGLSALIYCWAPWCGPCQNSSPIVYQLSHDPDLSHITFVSVNTDDCDLAAEELFVRSIPSLFVWKDNEVVDFVIGVTAYEELKQMILKNLPVPV